MFLSLSVIPLKHEIWVELKRIMWWLLITIGTPLHSIELLIQEFQQVFLEESENEKKKKITRLIKINLLFSDENFRWNEKSSIEVFMGNVKPAVLWKTEFQFQLIWSHYTVSRFGFIRVGFWKNRKRCLEKNLSNSGLLSVQFLMADIQLKLFDTFEVQVNGIFPKKLFISASGIQNSHSCNRAGKLLSMIILRFEICRLNRRVQKWKNFCLKMEESQIFEIFANFHIFFLWNSRCSEQHLNTLWLLFFRHSRL